MAFGKDYWKAVIEDTARRLDISSAEVVDSLQDVLMQAHEAVGNLSDEISNKVLELGNDVQDIIFDISESLEDTAGLNDVVDKLKTFGEPGKVQDNPFTKFVNRNDTNTEEWQTRNEKITQILTYFGLKDSKNIREAYESYDDEQLDAILRIVRKYQG